MDTSMQVPGDIILQGGTHCDAVRMRFSDWFNLVQPRIASFSTVWSSLPRESDYEEREGMEGW
jgi:hypothetical protein